eukprot:570280-Rhodomonas_salina.1
MSCATTSPLYHAPRPVQNRHRYYLAGTCRTTVCCSTSPAAAVQRVRCNACGTTRAVQREQYTASSTPRAVQREQYNASSTTRA